jgi:hypothetical protein
MMKMKAVVVGDTVLLMDLVAIPGTERAKQWIEVSRVEKQDYLYSFDKTMVAEFETKLEENFKTGDRTVNVKIDGWTPIKAQVLKGDRTTILPGNDDFSIEVRRVPRPDWDKG